MMAMPSSGSINSTGWPLSLETFEHLAEILGKLPECLFRDLIRCRSLAGRHDRLPRGAPGD